MLLDFSAARTIADDTVAANRGLLRAGLADDRAGLRDAAIEAGILGTAATARHGSGIAAMLDIIVGEMNRPGPFDFGDRRFGAALRDQGITIASDQATWHLPPVDIRFAQRKISGTALLAARLEAKIDVRALVAEMLEAP